MRSVPDEQLILDFEKEFAPTRPRGVKVRVISDPHAFLDAFVDVVRGRPLPPHEQEMVCLPQASALRPWLQQKLADRLGCAASLYMPTIREYADALIRKNLAVDPSEVDRKSLTWQIYSILRSLPAADARVAPLRAYLQHSGGAAMPLARRLAVLFDSYQTYRPDHLERWRNGTSGNGHDTWQAWLWREIACKDNAGFQDRPSLIRSLIERVAHGDVGAIPERITIFGETVVPPMYLAFLDALSRHTEITWYVVLDRSEHSLSRVLGEDEREAAALRSRHLGNLRIESVPSRTAEARDSALAVIQWAIREGRDVDRAERVLVATDDASLRVHDCHSPMREVEVLRDQLLDAFDTIEGLRPSDVLIAVPDLKRYASLVAAVFSATQDKRLPVDIARDPRQEGTRYLASFVSLIKLLESRITSGAVLELLSEPAIGRAAQLDADDVEVIREWIRATNIRWGIDGRHRQEYGLPADHLNTWSFGLNRLLMGLLVGPSDTPIDGVLPYGEATLDRASVLGRFALWIQRLSAAASDAPRERSLNEWRTWLEKLVGQFLFAQSEEEEMAEDHLLSEFREMAAHTPGLICDFASLRSYLADVLGRFEGRGRLLSGKITVAEIERLRHVPARVIACIGLNDDVFPRGAAAPDFDLIASGRRQGDPDPRRVDKQSFLDLLLAAQDRLILTYNGRSQKDNSERAPSVVLDALLNACVTTFTTGDTDAAADEHAVRHHFVVRHPLQPFSPQYFDGSDPRLFSYEDANCIQRDSRPKSIGPFVSTTLNIEEDDDSPIRLNDLVAAWSNPSRFFCEKLGLNLRLQDLTVEDLEPLNVQGLHRYKICDRILRLLLDGETEERIQEILRLEGSLPSGKLGRIFYSEQRRRLETIRQEVEAYGDHHPIEVDLGIAGRRLVGRIEHVTDSAALYFRPSSSIKPKDRIRAWIGHLALAASGRARPTKIISTLEQQHIKMVDDPLQHLTTLVEGYFEMARQPKLLFPESSWDFANRGGWRGAISTYDGWQKGDADDFQSNDGADVYIVLLNRHHHPIRDMREEFEREALAFWGPIMKHFEK